MASLTKIFMTRNRIKLRSSGRKRKAKLRKQGTTPTRAALFGDEPKS